MAKTTIKQVVKGDKRGAKRLRDAAKLQRKLADIEKGKLTGISNQYSAAQQSIEDELRNKLAVLLESHEVTGANLAQFLSDNEAAEGDSSFANWGNQSRERQQTLDQVFRQGGGETDQLKAQAAALRNWNVNQQETMRNYADTLSNINADIGDTNVQTKSGMVNTLHDADKQQREAFNDYKRSVGEVYGSLMDYYGKAGALHGQASDAAITETSKAVTTGTKNQTMRQSQGFKNTKQSKLYNKARLNDETKALKAATDLKNLADQVYTSNVQTPEAAGFTALQTAANKENFSNINNAQATLRPKAPEGTTLRRLRDDD